MAGGMALMGSGVHFALVLFLFILIRPLRQSPVAGIYSTHTQPLKRGETIGNSSRLASVKFHYGEDSAPSYQSISIDHKVSLNRQARSNHGFSLLSLQAKWPWSDKTPEERAQIAEAAGVTQAEAELKAAQIRKENNLPPDHVFTMEELAEMDPETAKKIQELDEEVKKAEAEAAKLAEKSEIAAKEEEEKDSAAGGMGSYYDMRNGDDYPWSCRCDPAELEKYRQGEITKVKCETQEDAAIITSTTYCDADNGTIQQGFKLCLPLLVSTVGVALFAH
eukprot:GHVN01083789.1.p3 GENE.GHVN01083789.1~~GHVN01083789.1.p3  ORF type:complete len:278 (-),score=22.51 GHVN01083789.1:4040-4873(-)